MFLFSWTSLSKMFLMDRYKLKSLFKTFTRLI
jgi:hypothetical protein